MKKEIILKESDRCLYGYVDETDTWIIEPKFKLAEDFEDGLAKVKLDGKWGSLKADGTYLIQLPLRSPLGPNIGINRRRLFFITVKIKR